MRSILSLVFLTLLSFSVSAQSEIKFHHDWNDALAEATKTNKLIFMDAYTTWCGPCKMMSKNVFTEGKVAAFFNENFVNAKIDMEKGGGPALAKKYKVMAYPTLLFVDSEGNEVHRAVGYLNPEQFLELGMVAKDPAKQMLFLKKKYEGGDRSEKVLLNYSNALFDAYSGGHESVALEYMNLQKDWSTDENLKYIFKMMEGIDSPLFGYFKDNKGKFEALFGKEQVERRMEGLVYDSIYAMGEVPTPEQVNSVFVKAYPEKADMLTAKYKIRYALEMDNIDQYAEATLDYFKKFPSKQAEEYNEAAWNFYEMVDDKKMLKKGVKLAKTSVKLEDGYYNNDTLAALYYKLGKKGKATKAAEHAIALAKAEGIDPGETEELLKSIQAL
jgi:thioredoxin-related protein